MFNKSEYIDVDTGKVKVAAEAGILRSLAIGSCVVIVAFDHNKKIGGLAHMMLPGKAPKEKDKTKTKYVEDAIDDLFEKLRTIGVKIEDLKISLVGGADLLGESTISELVVESVLNYLKKLGIEPQQKSLGGTQRRSISLDISSGKMLSTEGDSAEKEW